jgi:hypothetical protein
VKVSASAAGSSFTLGRDFTDAALTASYVNGRLLSAADLTTDQQTLAARDRWIGRAAGAGVIDGLTVTGSATTVTVAPGLGLTGNGEPVVLRQNASLPLAVPLAEATTKADPAKFGCCGTPAPGDTALVAAGSYVLTARSASQGQGSVASAGPPGAGGGASCAAAWTAAGIEFRVTALPVGTTVAGVTMTTDNRRNLVAAWCFGTEQLADVAAAPFDDPAPYGPALAGIGADDLPLAVLAWDGQSIADVDLWSVRRGITTAPLGGDTWGLLTSDARISDGQARSRQFQEQVAELVRLQVAEKVVAADMFPVLPPVGFLPIGALDQKGFATAADHGLERLDRAEQPEVEELVEAGAVAGQPAGPQPSDDDPNLLSGLGALERAELLLMSRAFAAAGGSGFARAAFFGTSARFGGVIDFGLAELLLRESWYRPPSVLPKRDPDNGRDDVRRADDSERDGPNRTPFDVPVGAADPQQPDPPGSTRVPPLTLYLVRENLAALAGRTISKRHRLLSRRFDQASVGGAYVVFVANYRWYGASRPPVTLIDALAQLRR